MTMSISATTIETAKVDIRERPILFQAAMVRALLAGTKTQTRRIVKLPHSNPLGKWEVLPWGGPNGGRTRDGHAVPFQNVIGHSRTGEVLGCPHGQPGDRLWVREAHGFGGDAYAPDTYYRATNPDAPIQGRWHSSIHMQRTDSRITLEVTDVRVERLQDLSEADARAEGAPGYQEGVDAPPPDDECEWSYLASFLRLWNGINGDGSWESNPWVWVIEFKRVTP